MHNIQKYNMYKRETDTLTVFRLQPSEFNFILSISLVVPGNSTYSGIDHILKQNCC